MNNHHRRQRSLADRVQHITTTDLRRLSARCQEIGGINLSQGVCDLPVPPEVKEAAHKAIDDGRAIYTNIAGLIELRQAIAHKMKAFNGITVDPQTEIAVTVGSTGAWACVAMALLNPGDEVVVFSPGYYYYLDAFKMLGVKARIVDTKPPDWKYSKKELVAAFNKKTRMVIVNTPTNPTGKVYSHDELLEIAALAKQYDAWIIADEIYEYITFETDHVSIASLPDAQNRTITLSGPSKTYAVTGWRIGYAVGPAEVIDKVLAVNDLFYICAPAPMQYGVLAAMNLPQSFLDQQRKEYRQKRDMLADALSEIGFVPHIPQGAFYIMTDFGPNRYRNSLEAAESILEQTGVATVPGTPFCFYEGEGETLLRICFAKRFEVLEEACQRLKQLKT